MGKPFKIDPSTPSANATAPTLTAAPTRDASGRFTTQLTPPAPPQVVDRARADGKSVDDTVAEVRVPDHPLTDTTKTPAGGYREQNPWPAAGPINDGNRKPMRVG